LRDRGRPWDWSKAFDASAVTGAIRAMPGEALPAGAAIRLTVNGGLRQESTLGRMIWAVPEIIAALSTSVEIRPGDLVFTGTPDGVAPLLPGDVCAVSIDGLPSVTTTIAPRA